MPVFFLPALTFSHLFHSHYYFLALCLSFVLLSVSHSVTVLNAFVLHSRCLHLWPQKEHILNDGMAAWQHVRI